MREVFDGLDGLLDIVEALVLRRRGRATLCVEKCMAGCQATL